MSDIVIETKNLTKVFKRDEFEVTALKDAQIEINRGLYMDERTYQPITGFSRLATDLEALADRLAEIPLEELRPYRAAAE